MLLGILDDLNAWANENQSYILTDVIPVLTDTEKPGATSLTDTGNSVFTNQDGSGAVTAYVPVSAYKRYATYAIIGLAVFAGVFILKRTVFKKRGRR